MNRCIHVYALFFFFFQAEDGIRDRSVSRGLGDVYKNRTTGVSQSNGGKSDLKSGVLVQTKSAHLVTWLVLSIHHVPTSLGSLP